MSRARVIVVGAALALFVFTGTTAIDRWVGDLTRAFEWKGDPTEIVTGTAAIPVWRRHVMHTCVRRYMLLSSCLVGSWWFGSW